MYKTIFNHMGMFVKGDGPFGVAPLRTLPHELGSNQQSLKFHKKIINITAHFGLALYFQCAVRTFV